MIDEDREIENPQVPFLIHPKLAWRQGLSSSSKMIGKLKEDATRHRPTHRWLIPAQTQQGSSVRLLINTER